MRSAQQRGITLLEILVAAVIAAVVVGGTMTAFLTATKVSKVSAEEAESASYAQQTIERFRNLVACRQQGESASNTWFNAACQPELPAGEQADTLPGGIALQDASRTYQATAVDCDGDGTAGDCLQVTSKVHWSVPQ